MEDYTREITLQILQTLSALLIVCSLAYISLRLISLKKTNQSESKPSDLLLIDRLKLGPENELIVLELRSTKKRLLISKNKTSGLRLLTEYSDQSESEKIPVKIAS